MAVTKDRVYRACGETGYTLRPAVLGDTALKVTPHVGLGYLHAHTDAFAETGAEALSVQAMDTNSLATTLGVRVATVWRIGDSVFRPALRAGWRHEWLDASATVHATFVQAPGSVMTATGAAFSRESFVDGAGITTDITSSIQIFANYDAKVNGGYVGQVVSGGFHVSF
jgi:outer membrane autotransporter protein